MPFWIKSDFVSTVCLESLTIGITLLEYPRISPPRERGSENCPRKDATLFVEAVLSSSFFAHPWKTGLTDLSTSENCLSWTIGVFLSYLNN